jgi:hypothetical protein
MIELFLDHITVSYKKKQWRPPSKKKKRGKNISRRNRKACHNIDTALLKSVPEIGTHSAMKSSRKTLHEFTSHIPQKLSYFPILAIAMCEDF